MAVNFLKKGINTSDATATINDILEGKSAYVNNEKIEGGINTTYTTSTSDNYINRPIDSDTFYSRSTISPDGSTIFRILNSGSKNRHLYAYEYNQTIQEYEIVADLNISNFSADIIGTIIKAADFGYKEDNNICVIFVGAQSNAYGGALFQYDKSNYELKVTEYLNGTGTTNRMYNPVDITNKFMILTSQNDNIINMNLFKYSSSFQYLTTIAPDYTNVSSVLAWIPIIINDNCVLMESLYSLSDGQSYAIKTTLLFFNDAGNIINNYNLDDSFVPNNDMNYVIVNGEVKELFVDTTTGNYSLSNMNNPIIIPNTTENTLYKWLDNKTLIAADYFTGECQLYKIDFENSLFENLNKINLSDNSLEFSRMFCKYFSSSSFMGNAEGLGFSAFVKESTGQQKLVSLTRLGNIYDLRENTSATSEDLLRGKTAYSNGQKIIGKIINNGAINITPKTIEQNIPAGYTNGGKVTAVDNSIDGNIQANNIKENVTILGVTGTLKAALEINPENTFADETAKQFYDIQTAYDDMEPRILTDSNKLISDDIYCIPVKSDGTPLLDTSNITSMQRMFDNCTNLKTIPTLDTSNVIDMNSMFYDCPNLTTIPVLDTSKITDMSGMFSDCPNLTNDSLNNILTMLTNATQITTTNKKLIYVGLSETQAQTCTTLSNWTACQEAGWVTGY